MSTGKGIHRWYAGTYGYTNAKADGLFAGAINTPIIIAAHAAIGDDSISYAARACIEYKSTVNGVAYGGWYMPSLEELKLMYQNRDMIDATATANGGAAFYNFVYFSSTEFDDQIAWAVSFGNGGVQKIVKVNSFRTRAVKAF